MKFRQHIPGYVEADPFIIEFKSLQDLLTNKEIQQYINNDFFRFSKSVTKYTTCLMVEYNLGKKWMVIGYAPKNSLNELPSIIYGEEDGTR